jgi:tetratricopeptide (TPR) repeat protein
VVSQYNRAHTLRQQGRTEEAIAGFTVVISLDSDHSDALYSRACLLALSDRHSDALTDLESAIALDPEIRVSARDDPDFDSLRTNPRFIELIAPDDELSRTNTAAQ